MSAPEPTSRETRTTCSVSCPHCGHPMLAVYPLPDPPQGGFRCPHCTGLLATEWLRRILAGDPPPDDSIPVTYDQGEFERAAGAVDWGVLVTDGQEGLSVYICAESPADAARHLRDAADAIEADAKARGL